MTTPTGIDVKRDYLRRLLQDCKDGTNRAGLLSKESASVMLAMLEAVSPRDPISGFIQSKNIKSAVEMCIDGREMEVIAVGADISNLRGLNLILSGQDISSKSAKDYYTKEANQVLGMVTEIFRQELERLAPHNGTGDNPNVLFFHNGGDELSAVIIREKAKKDDHARVEVKDVMKNITDRTSALVRDLGLADIMHAKKDKRTFKQRGVGITVAAKEIKDLRAAETFLQTIDEQIEKLKKKAAVHNHDRRKPAENGATVERRKPEPRMVALYSDAEGIKDNGMFIQFSKEKLQTVKKAIRNRYALEGPVLRGHTSQDLPFNILAPDDVNGPVRHGFSWLNPETKRRSVFDIVQSAVAGHPNEFKWLNTIYDGYEKHRKQGNMVVDPIESVVNDYFRLRGRLPDEPVHLVAYEVQNFAGLNMRFKHDGCDKIFDFLMHSVNRFGGSEIAYDEQQHSVNEGRRPIVCRPGGKGSIVYALVPGRDPFDMHLAITAQVGHAERFIDAPEDMGITEAVNLRELENPRHPDRPGVRVVAAAIPLQGEGAAHSAEEALQKLRVQLDTNIKKRRLFDARPIGWDNQIGFDELKLPAIRGEGTRGLKELADAVLSGGDSPQTAGGISANDEATLASGPSHVSIQSRRNRGGRGSRGSGGRQ